MKERKEVIKTIKQGLIGATFIIYVSILLGLVISGCECNCKATLAKIGEVNLYKTGQTYQVVYTSSLDRTETTGSSENSFELSLIKTVVDAGVNKVFPQIFVRRECFDQLRKAYGTIKPIGSDIYKNEYTNPILSCELYGGYNNALNAYDKNMYDSTMIDKIIVDNSSTDNPRKVVHLITR